MSVFPLLLLPASEYVRGARIRTAIPYRALDIRPRYDLIATASIAASNGEYSGVQLVALRLRTLLLLRPL